MRQPRLYRLDGRREYLMERCGDLISWTAICVGWGVDIGGFTHSSSGFGFCLFEHNIEGFRVS